MMKGRNRKMKYFCPNDTQDTNSFVLKKYLQERSAGLAGTATAVFATDIGIQGGSIDTYVSAVGIMYVLDNCCARVKSKPKWLRVIAKFN